MIDLTPIVAILQSLGPWGWGAAALLVMFQMRRNGGKSPVPAPNSPTPAAPDVPGIVDDIVSRLLERIKNRFPNVAPLIADGPVEGAVNLADEHAKIVKAIASRKAALLGELHSLPGSPGT